MRSLITLAAAALLAVVGPAVVSAAPVTPTVGVPMIGIGVSDAPGQVYIMEDSAPGTVITRHVRVSNTTGTTRDVSVYAASASLVDGSFTIDQAGETNALTSWTTVDKSTLRLNDGEDADVTVRIAVPSDAPSTTLHGMIWAAVDGTRVGVRMYVTVDGNNGPAADFTVTGLTPQRQSDGTATVLATVTNTGGRAIDLTGTLRLTNGPGGKSVSAVLAQPTTLAAGTTGTVLFVIPDSTSLPAGPWTAKARIRNGYFSHDLSEQVTFPEKPSGCDNTSTSSLGSLGSLGSLSSGSLGSGSPCKN